MALGITKSYTPSSGQIANSSGYNTDISALFNSFSGLEAQTSSLGGLTITPSANGVTKFLVTNAAATEIFSVDTTNNYLKLIATGRFCLDGGGDTYLTESAANIYDTYVGGTNYLKITHASTKIEVLGANLEIDAAKKLYFDGGAHSYISEASNDVVDVVCGGTTSLQLQTTNVYCVNLLPASQAGYNLGEATYYWSNIDYKTLTDRGCLGWFDEGVELQNGTVVSDTEALLSIKKHPTKKTIYGKEMLDYKTFPKVAYKKADKDGVILPRNENDEPYLIGKNGETLIAADGIEMTSMFSIMIGALKELTNRVKVLEAK